MGKSPDKVEIPKSVELYLEGAKWLVALSAGLMAFGMAALDAHPGQTEALVAYTISAALLSVAIASALFYLWYSYTYASLRQTGSQLVDPKVGQAKALADMAFAFMTWAFGLGLIAFAAFAGVHLWGLRNEDHQLLVHLGWGDRNAIVVQRGDRLWTLQNLPNGKPQWMQLPQTPKSID